MIVVSRVKIFIWPECGDCGQLSIHVTFSSAFTHFFLLLYTAFCLFYTFFFCFTQEMVVCIDSNGCNIAIIAYLETPIQNKLTQLLPNSVSRKISISLSGVDPALNGYLEKSGEGKQEGVLKHRMVGLQPPIALPG